MSESRSELINIVGRILCPDDWDDPGSIPRVIRSKHPLNLAEEIVAAIRPEANDEPRSPIKLNDWHSDCGGDWVLSGPGYFANYWPDNTVIAEILDAEGNASACSGIQHGISRAECQAFAERWIREHLQPVQHTSFCECEDR